MPYRWGPWQKARNEICGPSGSGKSTLIRCINRLEEHQKGRIIVDGIELTNNVKNIEKIRAEVGMVFQHFNLFPHLTVLENCCLAPIWVRKMPRKEAEEIGMEYLERVQIPEQAKKYPGQLSGGERNRVLLAKTLRRGANLVLLDEPTNDLDVDTLRALEAGLESFPGCAVVISHDRWFLDRIATHVLAFEGNSQVRWFEGNFTEYEEYKRKVLGEDVEQPHRLKYKKLA